MYSDVKNYTANYNIFPEHQLKSSISGSSFKFQEISRISRSCRDPVCPGLTWVSRYQKKHSPTCTHNEIEEGLTKPYSLCFYIYHTSSLICLFIVTTVACN